MDVSQLRQAMDTVALASCLPPSTAAPVLSCLSPQLANVLSTEALFYTCIIPFICFFGAFAFVFYPLRDVLHPTGAHTDPRTQTRPSDTCSSSSDGCHGAAAAGGVHSWLASQQPRRVTNRLRVVLGGSAGWMARCVGC